MSSEFFLIGAYEIPGSLRINLFYRRGESRHRCTIIAMARKGRSIKRVDPPITF